MFQNRRQRVGLRAVLVDGVPVNEPGGAFDFGSLTTDNIERIEIVRGPASALGWAGVDDGPARR